MIDIYLGQTIWCRSRTGVDAYGQPVFAAAIQITGRWLEKHLLVRNAQGEQVLSEVSVTLTPEESVVVGDQLSADGVSYLTIIALSVSRGLSGEAMLKRAFL